MASLAGSSIRLPLPISILILLLSLLIGTQLSPHTFNLTRYLHLLSSPAETDLTQPLAIMAPLKTGDKFPADAVFSYIPYTEESAAITACGVPVEYNASTEWADKKVVVFAVPGAFTPSCSVRHLPGYIEKLPALKAKGVDLVAVLAYNDAFVMSAWSKANGVKDDAILFLSDPDTKFSKSIGWTLGERTGRYALVVDKGTVTYAEVEPGRDVTVSGAEAVLAKL